MYCILYMEVLFEREEKNYELCGENASIHLIIISMFLYLLSNKFHTWIFIAYFQIYYKKLY